MIKTEFKLNEEFNIGLIKLKCIKNPNHNELCNECYLYEEDICTFISNFIGPCESSKREDKTNVIFVKI